MSACHEHAGDDPAAAERAASNQLGDAFDRWYSNPTPESRADYEQAREAHVAAYVTARVPDA